MSSTQFFNITEWSDIGQALGALSDIHRQGEYWATTDLVAEKMGVDRPYAVFSLANAAAQGWVESHHTDNDKWHLKPRGYIARVIEQKMCDSCKYDRGEMVPAFADARPRTQHRWGSFCVQCFVELECTLGTGFGQIYLVRPND